MIFSWWKARRRSRILAAPFPAEWGEFLQQSIPQIALLSQIEQERARQTVQVFMAEKNWEGCNGFKLTEEIQVLISGMVGLLVAGFSRPEYFDQTLSILVYPESYVARNVQTLGDGTWLEGQQARIGEAWYRGPVIVSWSEIRQTIQNETFGRNVVLHEFAHQLDMLNGSISDGVPVLPNREREESWNQVMQRAFEQHAAAVGQGERTLIDSYAATSRAEFFAVVTELFFEAPTPLRHWHPDVYTGLSQFYGLDPACWG